MALVSYSLVSLYTLNQLVNLLTVVLLSIECLFGAAERLLLDSDALIVTIFAGEYSPLIVDEHALFELSCN